MSYPESVIQGVNFRIDNFESWDGNKVGKHPPTMGRIRTTKMIKSKECWYRFVVYLAISFVRDSFRGFVRGDIEFGGEKLFHF